MAKTNEQIIEELRAKVEALEAGSRPATIEDVPAEPGLMKTATIVLGLAKGQTVVKTGITPAEMQALIVMHMANYQDDPIRGFRETEPVQRTTTQEITRLRMIYGRDRMKALYGPNSALPATFQEAHESGKTWAVENPPEDSSPLVGRRMTAAEAAATV